MKVIHIALGKANPNRMNGVSKSVYEICSALSGRIDVEFWGLTDNIKAEVVDRSFTTNLFARKITNFLFVFEIIKAIKQQPKQTIFHLHGGFIIDWVFIGFLIKLFGFEYIFTPHGSYNRIAFKKNNILKIIYFFFFENIVLKNAKFIHLLGKSESEIVDKYYHDKIIFIPNFIDIDKVEFPAEISHSTELNLLFIGRIDIYTKGLDLLFNALFSIENKIHINCLIAGDSNELAHLKHLQQKYNLQNISFLGQVNGDEKDVLFQKTDVLVLASRNEGFPMVVLEAALKSIPVIVSSATNVNEFVEMYNAGWVFNSEDTVGLASSIKQAYQEKMTNFLIEKKHNSFKMVKELFSSRTVVNQYISLYVAN